jgi:hypothetical protein
MMVFKPNTQILQYSNTPIVTTASGRAGRAIYSPQDWTPGCHRRPSFGVESSRIEFDLGRSRRGIDIATEPNGARVIVAAGLCFC